jgi:hypothetical protein
VISHPGAKALPALPARALFDRRIAMLSVAAPKLPHQLQLVEGRPIHAPLSLRGGVAEPCAPQWCLYPADAVLLACLSDFPVTRRRAMLYWRRRGTDRWIGR